MDIKYETEAVAGLTDDPDILLVQEFVSGSEAAFDRIYQRNSEYVYNVCLSMLGNPDDARDALQDIFVSLYKNLQKFRGKSKVTTWIYRVTVNKCKDVLRSRPKWISGDSLDWLADERISTEDRALEQRVRGTILGLKPEYRAALTLFYFQQLSCDEIAEVMNVSVNSVRVLLHRARKVFRARYGDGDSDEM